MTTWGKTVAWVDRVPSSVWVILALANLVLTAATWSLARRRVRRAGQRAAWWPGAPGHGTPR
jgi:hypothetical protein